MNRIDVDAAHEWKLGWKLVLAAMIGFSFHSIMGSATGLFMDPLGTEFGWNRAQQSMGLSISSIVAGLLSPFFGSLIDRWGSRRIALPGLLLMSCSVASFGLATGSIPQWIILWLVFALVSLMVKSTVWAAAVSSVFSSARGLALGVTLSGAAVAQVITPPLINYFIDNYGWRSAFVAIGFGWGGIALIASLLFLYDARDRRRVSVGDASRDLSLPGLTVRQAWRDPSLWKIAISTLIIMTTTMAILVHQFPLLIEAGVSRTHAAALASAAGAMGVVGKLLTGWFLDRWHGRWVGGITLALSSLTFILLLESIRTTPLIVVAMLINGYAAATKLQVCGYLTTRYAGLHNFGAIFGFMASVIALGSGLGPVLGGLSYDAYGSYTPLLIAGIVGCFASATLVLSLKDYPLWEERNPVIETGLPLTITR